MVQQLKSDDFIGNKLLHKMLTDTINGGHLCHAYLFCGDKNLGKRTLAKSFAKSILCAGKEKPCGECKSCRKADANSHPDIYFFESKEGRNSIHIDSMRTIRQDAYIRPNESEYKIYIIPNVQYMSSAAANALLKVLEEPPPYVVFIMTAVSKSAVLETVRSRCVTFEVFPLTDDELVQELSKRFPDINSDELSDTAAVCGGNLGRAIDILSNESFEKVAGIARQTAEAIAQKNEYEIMTALAKANSREIMLELLSELTQLFSTALKKKLNKSGIDKANGTADKLAEALTVKALCAAANLFEDIRGGIDKNINLGLAANKLSASLMNIL